VGLALDAGVAALGAVAAGAEGAVAAAVAFEALTNRATPTPTSARPAAKATSAPRDADDRATAVPVGADVDEPPTTTSRPPLEGPVELVLAVSSGGRHSLALTTASFSVS
jgi:hypothetical protein